MNLEGIDVNKFDPTGMDVTDKWILSRLAKTTSEVTQSLDDFKFSEPLMSLYRFFWNDLCDWYLEWVKPRMQDPQQKPIAQNVLAFVMDQTLRLLHPFIPFITEGIFQKLNEVSLSRNLQGLIQAVQASALVTAQWPNALENLVDESLEEKVEFAQDTVKAIRDIRSKYNLPPGQKLIASARASGETAGILNSSNALICQLAGLKEFAVAQSAEKPANAAAAIVQDAQIYLHDVVDIEAERARFEKQKQEIENAKKAVMAKLDNKDFLAKAKPQVVTQAKEKLSQLEDQLKNVQQHLKELI
jgi:valyl-tRNA synthetase